MLQVSGFSIWEPSFSCDHIYADLYGENGLVEEYASSVVDTSGEYCIFEITPNGAEFRTLIALERWKCEGNLVGLLKAQSQKDWRNMNNWVPGTSVSGRIENIYGCVPESSKYIIWKFLWKI